MEELLQYCMHELAFDGDLGCNIGRLKLFIRNYYESRRPSVQTLDDAFYTFLWQLLRQQPSIKIGLFKEASLEVYVAPQKSKKSERSKLAGAGEDLDYAGGLELINQAQSLSLTELFQNYGDSLRIAVDPETCFRALTGSHIRPSKLTPMVYTALQLISRNREEGLSVIDLGKKTGYDQKTCFYLVKQLLSMDLIVKLSRGGPGGGNFCIHKSFYIRSPFWQGIREEAGELSVIGQENIAEVGQSGRPFDEIDSRHLASPDLIKSRIIKLLKISENGLFHYHNVLVAIGFSKPNKRDRRFFATRIREFIKAKVFEKVLVPRKDKPGFKALCIRLVEDPRTASLGGVVVQNDVIDDEEQDQEDGQRGEVGLPQLHMTIPRQIVQLLEEAGAAGLTLNDISIRLGGFDRRTLDLMLRRLANPSPSHLTDLRICIFIENSGRERRNRYFTLIGYDAFIQNEGIDVAGDSTASTSLDNILCGGFQPLRSEFFYSNGKDLAKNEDEYRDPSNKLGRPRKSVATKPPESTDIPTPVTISNRGRKRRRSEDDEPIPLAPLSKQPRSKKVRISKTNDGSAIVANAAESQPTASSKTDAMDMDSGVSLPDAGPLASETNINNKRTANLQDFQDTKEPTTKRLKSDNSKKSAVNISQLRAENEIMRVVNEFGGIANIASKEFFEAHLRLLISSEASGEPISMPVGTQLDRRTLRKILERLVEKGRLKSLTVTVVPRSIQPRLAKLIYTPDTPQEKLDGFIKSLQDPIPIVNTIVHKELDDAVDYSRPTRSADATVQSVSARRKAQFLKKQDRPSGPGSGIDFPENEQEMRVRLLADNRTSSQLFGFILGKVRRARELHQFTLQALSQPTSFSNIVSVGDRIVSFRLYLQEIPVSTYFSIISTLEYNQDLYDLMKTPSGRQMRIGDLPSSLYEALKIGKARTRSRLLDLMEILVSLGLVVPLKPSDSNEPSIIRSADGLHPSCYDVVSVAADKARLNQMSSYWQFKELAPVYHYSQSDWPLPFHRDMLVRTADESMAYWDELEKVCLEKDEAIIPTSMESITGPCKCISSVAQALRKRQSWSSAYMLSWEQEQYLLYKWTDPSTGYTPLSDEDGGRRLLIHICEVISAPFDTVYNFFLNCHQIFQKEARRLREREHRRKANAAEGQHLGEKALLAKRIADAKQQLASDWDSLIQQVRPGLSSRNLSGLKDLRTKYMQYRGAITLDEWKHRISETLLDLESKDRPTATTGKATRRSLLGIVESTQGDLSVKELVQKLKDTTPSSLKERKRTELDKGASGKQSRPQRFHWTAEYDELARDASAILRCRCRSWHRMDWSALDQVFPSLPRNNVRQRIVTLRQEPGGESYFRRLEDQWYAIWMEYRQTVLLPDPNPDHPFNFDLIAHIEFLRKSIDKNLLKFGSLSSETTQSDCALSGDISDFLSKWDVTEYPPTFNSVDIIWSSVAEEQRENLLLRQVFVTEGERDRPRISSSRLDDVSVAESALKMVLSTPENCYDASLASSFLESVGKHSVGLATENLIGRSVITEAIKSERKAPGRTMRITDLNQEASGGLFRHEFYKQALAVDEPLEEDIGERKEWDLLCQGGQMAALVDLVSRGEIQFAVDISEPIFHRKDLDWNSKKVDDDQIEAKINVFHQLSYDYDRSSVTPSDRSTIRIQLKNHESDPGSACRLTSKGVINCSSCLEMARKRIVSKSKLKEGNQMCLEIMQKLDAAGSHGLNHETVSNQSIMSDAQRLQFLRHMLSIDPPLCYWTGYDQPILVSAQHIRPWTVLLPAPPTTYIFPRRWIDLRGNVTPLWRSALCAVVSVLFVRLGLSLAELRRKLVSVYDRQEVNDILYFLLENGFISTAVPSGRLEYLNHHIRDISVSDEEQVSFFLASDKRWYDVFKE